MQKKAKRPTCNNAKKMPNGQKAKKDAKTAKRPKMPIPLKMPGWHLGYLTNMMLHFRTNYANRTEKYQIL